MGRPVACNAGSSRYALPITHYGGYQSILAPERLITSAHLALSFRMNAANCSGVPLMGSEPIALTFSLNDGLAAICWISLLSRAMMGFGVPTGATMPVHVVAS